MEDLRISLNDIFALAESIASKKLKGWKAYGWQRAINGHIIEGAVPVRYKKSGKNKGKPVWPPSGEYSHDVVVLSEGQVVGHFKRQEKRTGRCHNCRGQMGLFVQCARCGGSRIIGSGPSC